MITRYESVKKWRNRAKERAFKAFGGKCGICGYSKCLTSIHFHHLDPTQKEFGFSNMRVSNWSDLVNELKKCICLCANCHGEVESGVTKIPHDIKRFDDKYTLFREPKNKYDKCPVCLGQKNIRFKYCSKSCSAYAKRKIDWDRFNLKDMYMKGTPVRTIGTIMGVSGNAVKKKLIALGIFVKNRKVDSKNRDFYPRYVINKTSGYRGVSSRGSKYKKRWKALLSIQKDRVILIGSFYTAKEAAIAYDKKAKEVLGNEAVTNELLGLL